MLRKKERMTTPPTQSQNTETDDATAQIIIKPPEREGDRAALVDALAQALIAIIRKQHQDR